eukprot:TRINITY_DN6899_c0_g1_i1.p1 TRINITY_DN6899_c0_g1~~TRINITY_DN6899_c0_g1_i1.p1  ORF type:complete len:347 (+),score=84.06 TRINITY_DN6899_c0_g1_i1:47-1087(+)
MTEVKPPSEVVSENTKEMEILKVTRQEQGMRIDRFIKLCLPSLPQSVIQKLLRQRKIQLKSKKGEMVLEKLEAGRKVNTGDSVLIPSSLKTNTPPHPRKKKPKIQELSPKEKEELQKMIVHKDKDILALNKPVEFTVQGGERGKSLEKMMSALQFEAEEPPRLVHRIDKATSGVLLLARNRLAAVSLSKLFRERKGIEKVYWALLSGVPHMKQGEIRTPVHKAGQKMIISPEKSEEASKLAITSFRVIDHQKPISSVVEMIPKTGRMHQLRLHASKVMKAPIIGDHKYGNGCPLQLKPFCGKRPPLHLHAKQVTFNHPTTMKRLTIFAPLPAHFTSSLKNLGYLLK